MSLILIWPASEDNRICDNAERGSSKTTTLKRSLATLSEIIDVVLSKIIEISATKQELKNTNLEPVAITFDCAILSPLFYAVSFVTGVNMPIPAGKFRRARDDFTTAICPIFAAPKILARRIRCAIPTG